MCHKKCSPDALKRQTKLLIERFWAVQIIWPQIDVAATFQAQFCSNTACASATDIPGTPSPLCPTCLQFTLTYTPPPGRRFVFALQIHTSRSVEQLMSNTICIRLVLFPLLSSFWRSIYLYVVWLACQLLWFLSHYSSPEILCFSSSLSTAVCPATGPQRMAQNLLWESDWELVIGENRHYCSLHATRMIRNHFITSDLSMCIPTGKESAAVRKKSQNFLKFLSIELRNWWSFIRSW